MVHVLPSPPWPGVLSRMERATRKALLTYDMLNGVQRLAVAVSGGKDSVALLSLLHAICRYGATSVPLVCLHVGGTYSCGAGVSESFLAELCEQAHIPLYVRHLPETFVPSDCYSCSRERRKLLFAMAREAGCVHIAFGHHKDDAIQTLMMNLAHKGEFAGLLPKITLMRYGMTLIRPLCFIDERELVLFARTYGLLRYTCSCPYGKESFRKKTAEVIEHLATVFPNAKNNLASAMLRYGSTKAALPPPSRRQQLLNQGDGMGQA